MSLGKRIRNGNAWCHYSTFDFIRRGPGFPCIHPAVFHIMVSDGGNGPLQAVSASLEKLPTVDDIPRDASTMDPVDMIDKV